MRSHYKRIGDFIRLVDVRNKKLEVDTLLGLSITKEFIPSVANTVGTNMANYKIIKKGQFACSLMQVRRDKKIPVALQTDFDKAIISQAYPVFEIIDKAELNPEYLMMWMSRSEFDRHACFLAVGGVRGSLEWADFCDMELPVPSIEKQREIVREYNVVNNRISLNEKLTQQLEDTAQAIYKQWFVDFEFPTPKDYACAIGAPEITGRPYSSAIRELAHIKSAVGLPSFWKIGSITELVEIEDGDRGKNYPKKEEFYERGDCLFLGAENVSYGGFNFHTNVFIEKSKDEKLGGGKLKRNDVVMTTRGSAIGKLGYYSDFVSFENIRINSGMLIFRSKQKSAASYIYTIFKSLRFREELKGYLSGSAQPQLPIKDIKKIQFLIPDQHTLEKFAEIALAIQANVDTRMLQNITLKKTMQILLSKMSK